MSIRSGHPAGEPWQWSATQIAEAIRARTIPATEVTTSVLARIRDTNPTVNALLDVDEQAALSAAEAADKAVAEDQPLGALHGVPVSIKVNTDQQGYATTNGIAAFADKIAQFDHPVVTGLRAAGAVLVGRSNVPSFSFRWFSENPLHGLTHNPWAQDRTPGGSSGGAAAAVAAGMVPIAHGNDIGGSIRYPAYACGVTGIRPTVGRVVMQSRHSDYDRGLTTQLMCVNGPIARTVADLRIALDAMTSVDLCDPASTPLRDVPAGPVRRVGLVRDAGVLAPHPSVTAALDRAAAWLTDAGIQVDEIDLPDLAEAYRLWGLLLIADLRQMHAQMPELADEQTQTAMRHMIEHTTRLWGEDISVETYVQGWTRRNTILRRLGQLFEEQYPVLLTPASALPPFTLGTDTAGDESTWQMFRAQWPQLALPVLGLPGLSVPTGVDADGLPTGVQLVGARYSEQTLLDVGQLIEDRAGTFTPVTPWGTPIG